jgi:hypothetical protein
MDLADSVPIRFLAQLEKTGTLAAHGLAPNWHKTRRVWYLLDTKTGRVIQASYRSNTLRRKGSEGMYSHERVENVFSTGEHSTALHRITITSALDSCGWDPLRRSRSR